MSHVSIYEKNWIDLVFEGKNKAYGAYQLRQENTKTSLIAFIGGITFMLSLIGGGLMLTSFDDTEVICQFPIIENERIVPVDMDPIKEQQKEESAAAAPQEISEVKPQDLSRMVVAQTNEATPDVQTNQEIRETPPANDGSGTGTLTDVGNNGGGDDNGNDDASTPGINEPVTTNKLDKLPLFPGGMDRFYKYVSNNINRPEIEEDSQITMSVVMAFVIEKDGSMTDIRALRSTDKNLEREAIRVLKSLKTKWEPGYQNDKPVRTLYMLPIKVKI
ncbi:energy transducer TonB [Flavobacterium cheonhonense]|uniref:Energy transducer TonB n=1 Tax=Flavobacterium cheonhonense TaxID=706185 RepID=A0ABP7TDE2_9FLAO|nr:energy transducer TonB [Flavobacterium cheonhonense]